MRFCTAQNACSRLAVARACRSVWSSRHRTRASAEGRPGLDLGFPRLGDCPRRLSRSMGMSASTRYSLGSSLRCCWCKGCSFPQGHRANSRLLLPPHLLLQFSPGKHEVNRVARQCRACSGLLRSQCHTHEMCIGVRRIRLERVEVHIDCGFLLEHGCRG